MNKPSKNLEGRRVRLVVCNDSYAAIKPGDEGTVSLVDDAGTLHVNWDAGSTLGLSWDAGDRWNVLSKQA